MNDQEHLQNLELPQPVQQGSVEYAQPQPNVASFETGQLHEQMQGPSGGGPMPMAQAQQPMTTAPTVATFSATPQGSVASATPLTANDHDLIEKEWVAKAKEIVDRTHGDPYVQNKEINKMKAEYIKKRYNKDIKQSA